MPAVQIQPFSDQHVDAAAELLAARHARHREAEPLLPQHIDFRAELGRLWSTEHASGAIAHANGNPVGYLLGAPRPNPDVWGPNIWVEYAGHAVDEPEIIRDLYAVAAANWVEEGLTRHYALVPATDPGVVDAWFRLSFGAQHAGGIKESPKTDGNSPSRIEVRRLRPEDVEAAVELDLVLPHYQRRSPVFGIAPIPDEAELRAEYAKDLEDPEVGTFIAELDGRPVGLLAMVSVEKSSMHSGLARPHRAALLAFAATRPEARGSGAGLALTNAGLAWARKNGYPVVVTDWRETNLLSSRFWPARGFRRTFLRLYRSIP
ncbi:MAG TPA: GNAT family N-acetyltransferase [Gaiellaceae bacterium]